jgi:hypothetical protein
VPAICQPRRLNNTAARSRYNAGIHDCLANEHVLPGPYRANLKATLTTLKPVKNTSLAPLAMQKTLLALLGPLS